MGLGLLVNKTGMTSTGLQGCEKEEMREHGSTGQEDEHGLNTRSSVSYADGQLTAGTTIIPGPEGQNLLFVPIAETARQGTGPRQPSPGDLKGDLNTAFPFPQTETQETGSLLCSSSASPRLQKRPVCSARGRWQNS